MKQMRKDMEKIRLLSSIIQRREKINVIKIQKINL